MDEDGSPRAPSPWVRMRGRLTATTSAPWAPSLETTTLGAGTFVFGAGLVGTFAAGLGVFRWVAPAILLAWLALTCFAVGLTVRRRLALRWPVADWAAVAVGALFAVYAGAAHHWFTHARMDIGFYHADAVIIATTGGRVVSGPFDGLLPGFEPAGGGYALATTYGYASLAALFVYVAGPAGAPWVNALLSFLTVLCLYLVGRHVSSRIGGALALGFFVTSLLTVWFARWLMTENASVATFWFGALAFLHLRRRPSAWAFAAMLVCLAYAAVVRPEGPVVAAWILLVALVAFRRSVRRLVRRISASRRRTALAAALAGLVLLGIPLVVLSVSDNYRSSGLELAARVFAGRIGADSCEVPVDGPSPNWGDYALRFEWESLMAYGFHWFALAGMVGLALGVSKRAELGTVFLLGAPYLLFVLLPPVTTFHPWFMRRLWIWLLPALFLAAAAALRGGCGARRAALVRHQPRSDVESGPRARGGRDREAVAVPGGRLAPWRNARFGRGRRGVCDPASARVRPRRDRLGGPDHGRDGQHLASRARRPGDPASWVAGRSVLGASHGPPRPRGKVHR
ncbi:MAG: hypothetical protein HYT80_02855 [Euryarchaeota archaeon]|nr:hypothetical protein [Euryarchaeota archaeon]